MLLAHFIRKHSARVEFTTNEERDDLKTVLSINERQKQLNKKEKSTVFPGANTKHDALSR